MSIEKIFEDCVFKTKKDDKSTIKDFGTRPPPKKKKRGPQRSNWIPNPTNYSPLLNKQVPEDIYVETCHIIAFNKQFYKKLLLYFLQKSNNA